MTSYRRGLNDGLWERYWHWNEHCPDYPAGTCVMQKDKPPLGLLCLRCLALDRPRPASIGPAGGGARRP